MTVKQFKELLNEYPDEMSVRLIHTHNERSIDFTGENIVLTSDTAHADDTFQEDKWDCEDGKIILGEGEKYLVLNPPIY